MVADRLEVGILPDPAEDFERRAIGPLPAVRGIPASRKSHIACASVRGQSLSVPGVAEGAASGPLRAIDAGKPEINR